MVFVNCVSPVKGMFSILISFMNNNVEAIRLEHTIVHDVSVGDDLCEVNYFFQRSVSNTIPTVEPIIAHE